MASVSRERAEIFRVGTYRISRFPGLSVIDYAAGACSRTSSTYAREILHATEMARPTINYGRTWYSIHGPARGDPVRIRKPLHAIAIDPDRINRVQPREKERERERKWEGKREGGRAKELGRAPSRSSTSLSAHSPTCTFEKATLLPRDA